jgi:hypothetical protein
VLDRLPELRKELAYEQSRGNATYAEVEESEADLERFARWLAKIANRDYSPRRAGRLCAMPLRRRPPSLLHLRTRRCAPKHRIVR